MSWLGIHTGKIIPILQSCPICRCRIFEEVSILPNSYQCTGCGAWILVKPLPEPEPHHNID